MRTLKVQVQNRSILKHPPVSIAGELQPTTFLRDRVMYNHPYVLWKQPVTQRVVHGPAEMINLPQLSSTSKSAIVAGGFVTVVLWGKKKQTAARFCTHQLRQLTKIKPDERGLLDLEDVIRAPTLPEPSDGFRVLFLLTCKFTALIQKENSWSQMSRSYVQFPPGVLTFSTWGK